MKNLTLILTIILLSGACNAINKDSDSNQETKIIIGIEEFYAQPEEYIGKEVTITGLVTHVCKHGGQKLFITGTEGNKALRIDVSEEIPEFSIEMEGSEAEFTGIVHLMDEEFVAQAIAEDKEHHGEGEEEQEEEGEDCVAEQSMKDKDEKNFYLVAQNFRTR